MPTIETRAFGTFTPPKESLFTFPDGLPGFPNEKVFLLIEDARSKPIVFLQSARTPSICFITLPASAVQQGYKPFLGDGLEGASPADVLCLVIITVAEGEDPTANLLAPIVIDIKNQTGVQMVQSETEFSHRHPLFAAVESSIASATC
jgi:flagellar assembly factor FliW